jgi:excisionase family DNA binding protein
MPQMVNEPLLTYAEAARWVGCSRQYIHSLAVRGKIPVVSLGKRRYVTLNGIRAIKQRKEVYAITHL